MKQTLTKDTFRFLFNQIRPDNFSYEGQGALFDYLESLEDDCGIEVEFDPIAFCCDFSQCSLIQFALSYPDACDDFMTDEERKNAIALFLDEVGIWYAFIEDDKEVIFQNI
jgi:hypothetical protein